MSTEIPEKEQSLSVHTYRRNSFNSFLSIANYSVESINTYLILHNFSTIPKYTLYLQYLYLLFQHHLYKMHGFSLGPGEKLSR